MSSIYRGPSNLVKRILSGYFADAFTRTEGTMGKRILIELQPTERTDLLCIACGGFINVGGLLKRRGFAIETAAAEEHQAGIHAACMPHVRAKRAPAKPRRSEAERREDRVLTGGAR